MGKKRLQQSVIDPSLSIKAVTKGSVWAISEEGGLYEKKVKDG